jgi:hypothetical protein
MTGILHLLEDPETYVTERLNLGDHCVCLAMKALGALSIPDIAL